MLPLRPELAPQRDDALAADVVGLFVDHRASVTSVALKRKNSFFGVLGRFLVGLWYFLEFLECLFVFFGVFWCGFG